MILLPMSLRRRKLSEGNVLACLRLCSDLPATLHLSSLRAALSLSPCRTGPSLVTGSQTLLLSQNRPSAITTILPTRWNVFPLKQRKCLLLPFHKVPRELLGFASSPAIVSS